MAEVPQAPAPSTLLRRVAYAEGTTLVLLTFIGMPLKYGFGITAANAILGPLHGIVFLIHAAVLLFEAYTTRRSIEWLIQAAIASLLPGGTFWFFSAPARQPA